MTTARGDRHRTLSASLAAQGDSALAALIDGGRSHSVGVGGGSTVADVDGVPVFIKRIPLTDLELAHRGSTANLFGLPLVCQYGIGGPGFNAWRELAANTIVTEAVLAGRTQSFPMLYHWRILPGRAPIAEEHVDIDAVVAAYGGDSTVRARLEALAAARCSLVLFSEYIPHPISNMLRDNPIGVAPEFERQLSDIVAALREHQLLHMDGHFGNLRSDGSRVFLTDFGLATSPHFELTPAEGDFVERHSTHDADYAAMRLVNWLVTDVCEIPMPETGGPVERNNYVQRCAAGYIPPDVPPAVAAILARHAPGAADMNALYWKLFGGDLHAEFVPNHYRAGTFPRPSSAIQE
ncbi:serine/threonine protein phosphatase [Nocardia sp. NBC_00511]|uniref:serine/threonine protein phosphatase n=1 Tax=Nocardia sp. NBC_00511 TaxID=2903591 RepID=UPI0030DDF8FD